MASKRMIDPETLKHFEILCSNGNKYLLLPYEHLADVPMVDAVEVVLCKDCERIKQGRFDIFGLAYCDLWKTDMQMDNYCCFGNRRADDGK